MVFPVFKPRKKEKDESGHVRQEGECATCIEPVNNGIEMASGGKSGEVPRFWLDKICIVGFPTLYIIFNISYWYYYV